MKSILVLVAGVVVQLAAAAAEFEMRWSTSDGGGGLSTSADGRFSLHGTAAQPDAGVARGGQFSLEGGYWNSVLCAYGLRISQFRDDTTAERPVYVLVTWPIDDNGDCLLEATSELHADPTRTVWTPVPFGLAGAGHYGFSAPASGAARFFRLRAAGR